MASGLETTVSDRAGDSPQLAGRQFPCVLSPGWPGQGGSSVSRLAGYCQPPGREGLAVREGHTIRAVCGGDRVCHGSCLGGLCSCWFPGKAQDRPACRAESGAPLRARGLSPLCDLQEQCRPLASGGGRWLSARPGWDAAGTALCPPCAGSCRSENESLTACLRPAGCLQPAPACRARLPALPGGFPHG